MGATPTVPCFGYIPERSCLSRSGRENLEHAATCEELWELISSELRCLFPVVPRADVVDSTLMVTDYRSCLITQPQVLDCTSKQHSCMTRIFPPPQGFISEVVWDGFSGGGESSETTCGLTRLHWTRLFRSTLTPEPTRMCLLPDWDYRTISCCWVTCLVACYRHAQGSGSFLLCLEMWLLSFFIPSAKVIEGPLDKSGWSRLGSLRTLSACVATGSHKSQQLKMSVSQS